MLTRIVQQDWFYAFAIWAFRSFARLVYGLKVTGLEHVPREGGQVVACNHFSFLDPPVVGVSMPREIHFMAKRELFERPASRLLMLGLRAFPVNREGSDTKAIRASIRRLKDGLAVGIFIQGTRNSGDVAALNGAAFLALRSGSQLLPTSVWREGRAFRVHFSEPVDLSEPGLKPKDATILLTRAINTALPAGMKIPEAAVSEPESAVS